jgi:hypothetical protein
VKETYSGKRLRLELRGALLLDEEVREQFVCVEYWTPKLLFLKHQGDGKMCKAEENFA